MLVHKSLLVFFFIIKFNSYGYILRSNNNLNNPLYKLSFSKKHVFYSVINIFNGLPDDLKVEEDLKKYYEVIVSYVLQLQSRVMPDMYDKTIRVSCYTNGYHS